MTELMRRRRALMGAGNGDSSILWQIKNQSVSGGFLSTDLPLCSVDQDYSIAYDVTLTTVVNSGDGSTPRFIRVLNNANNAYSLNVMRETGNSGIVAVYMGQLSTGTQVQISSGDRLRFVFYHAKNSNSATIIVRKNNDTAVTRTISKSFTASEKNAVLGQSSGTNQLPICTLNEVTIYNRVLTSAEINNFLEVSE